MTCAAFERLIALYVEGDLSSSELRRVTGHLQDCTACSELADDLRESQSVFKSLRTGMVTSSDLAGVRNRVLDEVGALEPAPSWIIAVHRLFFAGFRRRNAIAGVVLAALVSGSVWYQGTRVTSKPDREVPVEVARFEAPSPVVSADVTRPAEAPEFVKRTEPLEESEELPAEVRAVQLAVLLIDEPAPPESQVSQIPMKFVTDDPDIIIYWLPTDKGD
jgi:anti-sigma factor RsiW